MGFFNNTNVKVKCFISFLNDACDILGESELISPESITDDGGGISVILRAWHFLRKISKFRASFLFYLTCSLRVCHPSES